MAIKILLLCFLYFGLNTVSSEKVNKYADMFNNIMRYTEASESTNDNTALMIQTILELTKGLELNPILMDKSSWRNFAQETLNVMADNITVIPEVTTTETGNNRTTSIIVITTSTETGGNSTQDMTTIPTTNDTTTTSPFVVSELCRNHTEGVIQGLLTGEQWALRMFDATGKPTPSILNGALNWPGDYDECLAVQATYNISQTHYTFQGQYCSVSIYSKTPGTIYLGVCVPGGCSNTDTSNLFNTVLTAISGGNLYAVKVTCQEPDRPFDTRAIIVLVVVSIFIAIMVIGTGYDILMIQLPKWQKEESSESITEVDETSHLINAKKSNENEPNMAGKIILSFSIYTNASKILSTQQGAGSLTAINGIRFITMTWVILGHTCIFALNFGTVDNTYTWLADRLSRVTFGPIYNAFPAVDTFFALSGLLLTYLVMKDLKKNNGKMNWPMFYFHRFWRLTPPYMLIMMVYVSLFPYIGEGPGWRKDGVETDYCIHSWHRNLLYVNNLFVDGYDMCMAWSWYLANDMQFFVISPLIILPLFYYHLIGVAVLMAFLLGALISCGVLSAHYDLPASIFDGYIQYEIKNEIRGNSTKFFNEYVKPWNRIGPYLIGIYVGYILYRTDCKYRINKFVNILAWIFFTALACTVLYGLHEDVTGNRLSTDVAALYTTTHRIVWAACVCWVIFACATGNGGFINTILSWKALIPLSRLTYCAYLVHPIVIYYYLLRRHKLSHFSDTEVTYEFLGHLVLSYAVAFVSSLAFESPMMGLEKALLKRSERNR